MAEVMPTPGSSNIDQISYDAQTEDLEVTFSSGATYRYAGVPGAIWRGFQRAPSFGQYLNRVIKPRYPAEQI